MGDVAAWTTVHSAASVLSCHGPFSGQVSAEWAMLQPNGRCCSRMGDDWRRMGDVSPNGRRAEWAMRQKITKNARHSCIFLFAVISIDFHCILRIIYGCTGPADAHGLHTAHRSCTWLHRACICLHGAGMWLHRACTRATWLHSNSIWLRSLWLHRVCVSVHRACILLHTACLWLHRASMRPHSAYIWKVREELSSYS